MESGMPVAGMQEIPLIENLWQGGAPNRIRIRPKPNSLRTLVIHHMPHTDPPPLSIFVILIKLV